MSDGLSYLKPCPFCGRRDELVITHIFDDEDYIQCSRCRTGDVHRLVWNHRAESNPFSERVWLEEELKEKEFFPFQTKRAFASSSSRSSRRL